MIELLEEAYKILGKVHVTKGSVEVLELYQKLAKVVDFKVRLLHGNTSIKCQEIPDKHVRHALIEDGVYITPTQAYYKEIQNESKS
ncbi:hypothetical protein KAR91_33150 [Candidatus Pacearchaeota archaeon]|nr:hypothetical protein [Candidatus Pacearchaeota archaeon]